MKSDSRRLHSMAVVLASIGLVLGLAVPAHAVVVKDGTLNRSSCIQPSDPWARSYSDGATYLASLGLPSQFYNNPVFTVRERIGAYNGGYWFARVYGGALDDVNTYAWCRGA